MNFIGPIFSAIASAFNWMTGRDQIKNSPAMQAAAAAKSEQAQVDKATKAIATQDTEEIRKELAE